MTKQNMFAAVAVGLLLGGPGLTNAQYAFTPLDAPGASSTAANGNSPHDIVGEFDDEDGNIHGFVLSKGTYTTIDAPGADGVTVCQGINNAGQVAGLYQDEDGTSHGFVLYKGVYTTVDVPGALWTEVYSINAQGKIVGAYE